MNGLGVLDFIVKEHYDPETGETYEAMTSCNNQEMAERCKVKGANKVIWCINASLDFNSKIANGLRTSIKNGNINFLKSEFDIVESIKKVSGYKSMSVSEKAELEMPYIQTSLAVNEMVNLEFELVNNSTRLKERSGMRKDRYSSLAYNNYVVSELNKELKPKNKNKNILDNMTIRPAKIRRSF